MSRTVPPAHTPYNSLWLKANVPWIDNLGAQRPMLTPGFGVTPLRLRGPTNHSSVGGPLRLRESRPRYPWIWSPGNSYEVAFLPPPRLPLIDVVVLDATTSYNRNNAAPPVESTFTTGGIGAALTGAADRDLLLVMPSGVTRRISTHVWGYRGVYLIGGTLQGVANGTVTTTTAVNGTTVWNGRNAALLRITPHPDAVDPFVYIANLRITNNPAAHASLLGMAYGGLLSFGSCSANPLNHPTIYLQNLIVDWVPSWSGTLNSAGGVISEHAPISWRDGAIKNAALCRIDLGIAGTWQIGPSQAARPTAFKPDPGAGNVLFQDVQFRPQAQPTLYPYSQAVPIGYAQSPANVDAGFYNQITLDRAWSLAAPLAAANLTLTTPTTGSAAPIDRVSALEWTPFTAAGRTGPPVTGQLQIGTGPDMVPGTRLGYSRIVSSVDQLDGLIAGA